MNPLKQLAGQTAVYGMGTIVPRLLNYLLLTPFYTRVFIEGEYGMVTELYAYVAFLMVLLTYGMETAYFRFVETANNKDKVYTTALISLVSTSFLFIVLVVLFAQPIADLIRYSANQEYIIYFAFIIGIDAITAIPFARLRQQNKASRFAFVKIINVVVNISLNFFFLWLCPLVLKNNPESFLQAIYSEDVGIGYAFISNLVATSVTLILLFPEIFKPKVQFDKKVLSGMLTYAFPLLIVGLAGMVNEVSDKIIFKYLARVPEGVINAQDYVMAELGIYGANYKLAVLMTLFIQMFRYAAEPFFFSQAKKENAKQVYADVMKYFVIFGLLIFLGVTLYIDVFKYFIGPKFWGGLRIVPIVLLANLFLGIFFNLSVWYKLNDLTKYGAIIALIGSAITIVVNIILVPQISYLGAAWGHFICYLVMVVLSYSLGRKFFQVNYDIKRIAFYFFIALVLYALNSFVTLDLLVFRLILSSLLITSFIAIVYLFEKSNFKIPQSSK